MSFNGSGSFLINTAGQPVVSGTVISSTAFNALTADLATGLSTCITKDGQTTVTANIPMANYKFTGLGAGSGAADSANLSQVQSTVVKLLASVSGTDTITAVGSPTVAAYAAGQMFYFVAAGDNTGAVTINIDSLGAKAVTRDGSVALAAGDIKSGEVVVIVYDGTRFQVVSQLNSAGNATFANVSITSALNVGGVATFTGGTANGVLYLDGSKVATSGSALVFDGTNLGIGTSSPSSVSKIDIQIGTSTSNYGLQVRSYDAGTVDGSTTARVFRTVNSGAGNWANAQYDAWSHIWTKSASSELMRLDSSGSLGIANTSPGSYDADMRNLVVGTSGATGISIISGTSSNGTLAFGDGTGAATYRGYVQYNHTSDYLVFGTAAAERARITAAGDFLVNQTVKALSNTGFSLGSENLARFTRSAGASLEINRLTSDGDLIGFFQDTTQEGSISVSGNTVSYNAFAGSHWSQLQDGSKPDILRGTVMESINELCEWPDETNERLPKSKISDTAGSKKVYGVFMAWDNDWTETNDMYVTAVGAFICRVNGSVTVEEGDLLESNGDGTARVQADDIIRSSTIGKVTSTVKTHQYDDGSYCVPTVLYCG